MTSAHAIPRFACVEAHPIIVGYDRGDRGRDALALGRVLAGLLDAPLEVISLHPYASSSSTNGGHAWEDTTESDAEKALRRARMELADVPAATTRRVRAGSPALGLDLAAEEADASVIVVASTAKQLLAHTRRAVAVAPRTYASHAATPRAVAVAYDGGDEAGTALDWAENLSIASGAELRIVGVLDPTKLTSAAAPVYGIPGHVEDARDRAGALLQEIASRVSGAEAELLEGDPAECLARGSRAWDLLVIGTRRSGAVRRALLGSLSADLIEHASCPVVVVPTA
jgi:nucleotide-binding universal stress UspA family protein